MQTISNGFDIDLSTSSSNSSSSSMTINILPDQVNDYQQQPIDELEESQIKPDWSHVPKKQNVRSILEEVKRFEPDPTICGLADTINLKMKQVIRRKRVRLQYIYYCTYCAYLEMNLVVNPIELGKKFGLKLKEIQSCSSKFSQINTGYKPKFQEAKPQIFLDGFFDKLDLTPETRAEFTNIADRIINKDPLLLTEHPHTIAAGLLKYLLMTNGISIDDAKMTEITGRSSVTITVISDRMARIDNS